ncbi:uncharacterized protein QC763_204940 [Podospora pseudopauciseta]|uniref:Uncharacterized protein n=1 Tax=Podospora pseudopauciseta TaxID=2093780 RepID=A0ABR0HP07_9PEZI|nr:hypothetical protein QC763_204940 [Podospora pseudopauciseta]
MEPITPYRPYLLRLWFLVALVLVTTASLGLVEYSLHKLLSTADLSSAVVAGSDYNSTSSTPSFPSSVARKTTVTRTTLAYINATVQIPNAKATRGRMRTETSENTHISKRAGRQNSTNPRVTRWNPRPTQRPWNPERSSPKDSSIVAECSEPLNPPASGDCAMILDPSVMSVPAYISQIGSAWGGWVNIGLPATLLLTPRPPKTPAPTATSYPEIETETVVETLTVYYPETKITTEIALPTTETTFTAPTQVVGNETPSPEGISTEAIFTIQTVPNPDISPTSTQPAGISTVFTGRPSINVVLSIQTVPNPGIITKQMQPKAAESTIISDLEAMDKKDTETNRLFTSWSPTVHATAPRNVRHSASLKNRSTSDTSWQLLTPANAIIITSTSTPSVPTPRGSSQLGTPEYFMSTSTVPTPRTRGSTTTGSLEYSAFSKAIISPIITSSVSPNEESSTGGNGSYIVYVLTPEAYFLGSFAPLIFAILFYLPWASLDAVAKRMEPFYRLSSSKGAVASESLNVSYESQVPLVGQLWNSLIRRHWVVSLTSFLVILCQVLMALSPEAIRISVIGIDCRANVACPGVLSVSTAPARAMEAMLLVMIICTAVLAGQLWNRRSQLYSEPFSLAGTATLVANDGSFLQLFRQVDSQSLTSDGKGLEKALGKNTRYRLTIYKNEGGAAQNGIVLEPPHTTSQAFPATTTPASGVKFLPVKRSNPLILELCLLFLIIVIILPIIIWYYLNNDQNHPLEQFLSGQDFGVRFLFAAIGILIDELWKNIFSSMRPFLFMHFCLY